MVRNCQRWLTVLNHRGEGALLSLTAAQHQRGLVLSLVSGLMRSHGPYITHIPSLVDKEKGYPVGFAETLKPFHWWTVHDGIWCISTQATSLQRYIEVFRPQWILRLEVVAWPNSSDCVVNYQWFASTIKLAVSNIHEGTVCGFWRLPAFFR